MWLLIKIGTFIYIIPHLFCLTLFVASWTWKFDFYKVGAKFSIWFDIANKSYMQKIKSDIYSLSLVWCTAKWSMENSHYFQNWHIIIIISPITYQSSNYDQFICRFISNIKSDWKFCANLITVKFSSPIFLYFHQNSHLAG
jgi:hypothetical protein